MHAHIYHVLLHTEISGKVPLVQGISQVSYDNMLRPNIYAGYYCTIMIMKLKALRAT